MTDKRILVVAAHPDDEVLGCGGTIARHVVEGDQVAVVIMGEGITSRDRHRSVDMRKDEMSMLREKAKQAHATLGVHSSHFFSFPDNRMDSVERLEMIKVIEDVVREYRPDTVYTHFSGDLNIDHRCVHDAVVTACRPLPGHSVNSLIFFEVLSSTEFRPSSPCTGFAPNVYIDIEETLGIKIEAMRAYESELCDFPHPRSLAAIEHLAKWRGASVGKKSAEAFMLGRSVL